MKLPGSPFESGVPTVKNGDFGAGAQLGYGIGGLCAIVGAAQGLKEIASESRLGVAPFGRM